MSPELEKALIELRKVICAEHPHAIEAIIRFELEGRVEIDIQERQVSKL